MQRKSTAQSRGASPKEKALHAWVKMQPCGFCGAVGPSIVDHCKGSSFKQNKKLIGHIFVGPKCKTCDFIATYGVRAELFKTYGKTDSDVTLETLLNYKHATAVVNGDGEIVQEGVEFEPEELEAIKAVYAVNDDVTDWEAIL